MLNSVRIIPASGSLNFEYTDNDSITNNIELKYDNSGVLGFYSGSALLMAVNGTDIDVKTNFILPVVSEIPSNALQAQCFLIEVKMLLNIKQIQDMESLSELIIMPIIELLRQPVKLLKLMVKII